MQAVFANSAVVSFFKRMPAVYRNSLIGRIAAFFSACYETSGLRRVIEAFSARESAVDSSIYSKLTGWINTLLLKTSAFVLGQVDGSVTWNILQKIEKILGDSAIFRPLVKLGIRQLLILLISLYLPIDYVLRRAGINILASAWDEAFLLFCIGFLALTTLRRGETGERRLSPIDLPLLLFMAVYFFMMFFYPPSPSIAFEGFRAAAQYAVWFFVLIRLLETRKDILLFVYGFLACAFLAAVYGMYQYVVAAPIPETWMTSSEERVRTRIFSIVGSPNIMGSYMIMAACLSAGMMYCAKNFRLKVTFFCMTGLFLLNLLFTYSRGAWAGVAVAIFVFALLHDRRLIALMCAAMGFVIVFVPSISSRILFLFTPEFAEASALNGRSVRWDFAYQVLTEHPLTGMGPGGFGGAVAMNNQIIDGLDYFYMDNYYLKVAVETGLPGLILFLLLVAVLLWWGIRACLRTRRDPLSPLIKGAFAALAGVLFHCYSENVFEVPYMNAYFWCFAAIVFFSYQQAVILGARKKDHLLPRVE